MDESISTNETTLGVKKEPTIDVLVVDIPATTSHVGADPVKITEFKIAS